MITSWPTANLGQVLIRADERIDLEPERRYRQITVRLWGKGATLRNEVTGAEIAADRRLVARTGQLIASRIDARNGALAIVPPVLDGAVVSNDFPVFAVQDDILDPRFLGWMCQTRWMWELCLRASEGTTNRVRLQEERFLNLEIPLPPLDEQRRIVARIERLAALVQEIHSLHRQVAREIDALLAAASLRYLREQRAPCTRAIVDVAEVRGGIQKGPHRTPGSNPIRYLTVAHVHRNRISLADPRYFEVNTEELERWRLMPGDVLIIEGNGSADQIGRTALFRGEIADCVHQNHVIRIRPDQRVVDPEYLNAYLNSPVGQEEVQSRSRTTSGLRVLGVGRIKAITIPVPPLADQRRIVSLIRQFHSQVDNLTQHHNAAAVQLNALLPAIIDRAFKGGL